MTDYIRDLRPAEWGSGVGCTEPLMSALGQKQTLGHVRAMSALPPKADIGCLSSRCLFLTKSRTWREPHVGPFEQIIGLNSQVNSFSAAYLLLCRIIQLAI